MASDDILDQGKEDYEAAKNGWQEIYEKAEDDLRFLSDEPFAQWDAKSASSRTTSGRPIVEIDQLSQFVHQVSNDIRQNTPAIHVIPSDDGADMETAEMIQGRIKAIEYKSNADAAYDMAADFAVKSSIGFIQVDHDYASGKGFEQEIRIKRVVNPKAYLIDPSSVEPDGCDAKFGFVLESLTAREFKKRYPKASPVSFGESDIGTRRETKESITIAEYFYIEEESSMSGLLEDGTSEDVAEGKEYKSTREITKRTVMRCFLSGSDVLTKQTKFPGQYIPIIPVYGEESWIAGRRHLLSLIRKSKSSQMMYNELKSSETEILIKQLQAPVQAAVGQMRGFEEDWKTPDKAMVLYYHQTDALGQQAPAPQRLQPPAVSSGFANASLDAENNIRKTLGMYNAGVGKREGQQSGVALKQLEMSGDTASLHFGDNLNRSVAHVGRVVVSMLPEIEDTPRAVSIVGKEDELKTIGINGHVVEGQKRTFDFTKGGYDIRVIAGPSFTTQRQEAAAKYADIVGKMPDLMPVIGDLVFKYQDAPGSQAISARLKKMVDPKLLDESEREADKEGVNPEIQQITQEASQIMELAQTEIQQLQQQLSEMEAQAKVEEIKRAEDAVKVHINNLKLQERMAELSIQVQEKDLEAKQAKFIDSMVDFEAPIEGPGDDELLAQVEKIRARKASENEMQQAAAKQQDMQRQAIAEQEASERQYGYDRDAALLGTLSDIKETIGGLTAAIRQPKNIVFDKENNPIGIK